MPKKIDGCDLERTEILNKILQILEINENNKSFFLQDIDNNLEKQELIYNLEPDIKKYFITGKWNCFKTKDTKRKWLSIIRCLLKNLKH